MTFNAMTEHYEEITVCGKPALFTSIRIKRDPQHQGRIPDCPYRAGSLHRYIHFSPGMAEALPDSESRRCGGVRFGVTDVQKCRRGVCSVR